PDGSDEERARGPRRLPQVELSLRTGGVDVADRVVERTDEDAGEAVHLAGELVRGRPRREPGRIDPLERVQRVAQRARLDALRTVFAPDGVAELLGQAFDE